MAKRSVTKKGFNRAAVSTTSREFHPCSFKAALPIACDALNARTVAVKACLPSMRVVARKLLTCFPSRCCSLVPQWGSHGAPSVWLGAKRTYPVCPILRRRYLASLSLSRCLWGCCGLERNGKGGKTFRYRVQLFSPKREDCPHQFCLQPLANILVHAEIGVAALVVELSH